MERRSKKKKLPEALQTKPTHAKANSTSDFWVSRWGHVLQVFLIAGTVLWIYWPVLHGDWMMDDDVYITQNPLLRDVSGLEKLWFSPGSWIEYYPLEATVLWCLWQICGNDTLGYHLVSIALHIISALLVWRLLGKMGLKSAWLGGLIFAIYPVQVESVAWISELKNTLSLPPFLLAMSAWIDYEERKGDRYYWMALGLFLVAMLCKISMMSFPVILLLYAWWKRGKISWSDLKASSLFFVISFVLAALTILSGIWYRQLYSIHSEDVAIGGLIARLDVVGLTLSFYLWKCIWPVGLMPIYSKWEVNPWMPWQFLPWFIIGGIAFWAWTKRQSWGRHVILALGFFTLMLTPFLGIIGASYMSFTWVMDHFLYIAIIGLIGLAVAGLDQIRVRVVAAMGLWSTGGVALLLILLAWQSHRYAQKFTNLVTLWGYTVQVNPQAWMAYNNLGYGLAKEGRTSEAIEEFQKAVGINPYFADAHNNLGLLLLESGRPQEAAEEIQKALQISPSSDEAHNNLGFAYLQAGHIPEAIDQFRQTIQINPKQAQAHFNLGLALEQTKRFSEAMEQYQLALQINPNYSEAHNNLGGILKRLGRTAEARDQFKLALQSDSNNDAARQNLTKLPDSEKTVP